MTTVWCRSMKVMIFIWLLHLGQTNGSASYNAAHSIAISHGAIVIVFPSAKRTVAGRLLKLSRVSLPFSSTLRKTVDGFSIKGGLRRSSRR